MPMGTEKNHPARNCKGSVRRGRDWSAWALRLNLFLTVAGLFAWCAELPGAPTNFNSQFEAPPMQPGSVQWENFQQSIKDRQELYRKRLSLPDAVAAHVPIAPGANLAYGRPATPIPPPARSPAPGMVFKVFFFTGALLFCGFFVARRFAPRFLARLGEQFDVALAPVAARIFPAKVRAEDEAFAEFLTTLRVGPSIGDASKPANPMAEFFMRANALLGSQRLRLQEIIRETRPLARQKILTELCASLTGLKDESRFPETLPVWQMASALEGFLRQLAGKMGNVTPSTLRTVGGALDLLRDLCAPGLQPDLLTGRPLRFLVVDDDLISRQALSLSLNKAFSQPDVAVDGESALVQINAQAYDVIFLDVQMPGMDGYELCLKIRDTALNGLTPVVFVSAHCDFNARARSTLSGGNELMAKPFLTFEITVKALTLALAERLRDATKPLPALGLDYVPAPAAAGSPVISRPLLGTPSATTNLFTHAFLNRAATQIGPLRELSGKILEATGVEPRQSLLAAGFLRINSLTSQTGLAVVHPGHQVSVALEGLFRKLLENPKNSTPSALATIAVALELLADLCGAGLPADFAIHPPIRLLVVDDDLIARRALTGVLQTSFEKPESVEDGATALALAGEKSYDVIFLDVIMPGLNGFAVCEKIRATIPNRATPVVFVTSQPDAEARAQMSRSGGNDLLGKPFLTAEITVKAFTYALRARLAQRQSQAEASVTSRL